MTLPIGTSGLKLEKAFVQVRSATVRFAGDSGDGMQLAGTQFADIASLTGTVVRTLPDFPSEVRAPTGSLGGVSGFQISFGDQDVRTPGDSPYVLIAMNPAALKVNLPELQPGGIIIANEDEFKPDNLAKAGYSSNPLSGSELSAFRLIPVAMTRLNEEAVSRHQLPPKDAVRCRNFFALGLTLWLYDQPLQPMLEWLMEKFRSNPALMASNGASVRAGHNFADTAELFRVQHSIRRTFGELPVILLTAVNQSFPLGFSSNDLDPTWLPAVDFVEKPVDFALLCAKVSDILARTKSAG